MSFMKMIYEKARSDRKKIVLPEGIEPRMIKAVPIILEKGLADIVILGDEEEISKLAKEYNADISGAQIINPLKSDKLEEYTETYYQLRKHKGISIEGAREQIKVPLYFGAMMVRKGEADGKVAGSITATGDVLRADLKIIGTADDISIVSGFFIMIVEDENFGHNGVLVLADCAVNPNPDAGQLAEIAVSSARTAKRLVGMDPKVAMLSFSTDGSAQHPLVYKVQEATSKAREIAPDVEIDGEMQADAALIPEVAQTKYPKSKVAGDANVLVFPDLEAGNIGYKLVQRLGGAKAIGPILQGIAKPVNDLSRGCSVQDIVDVVAITAVQAQNS